MATCVVLGAGPGVGNAVAKAFANRGYNLALCARKVAKLEPFKEEMTKNCKVSSHSIDVGDLEALKSELKNISATIGPVEVLVFNAYANPVARPTNLEIANFVGSLNVNVAAALVAAQAVVEDMRKQGKGTLLFTGGGFALQPSADVTALSVGKAAIRSLAKCLYDELKDENIHAATVTICGMVQPGTAFDPDKIAETFLGLHDQAPGSYESEILFKGA